MYRVRYIGIVQYGKFREYADAVKQLSEVCAAKGWAVPRFLVPTAGLENEVVLEFEYPDLAALQGENRAQGTDGDFMKAYRSSAQYFYPQSARTEIYEDAFDIA